MAVKDTIEGSPLLAVDVRDTLSYYGGEVSDDFLTYFKSTANINEWSRSKPYNIVGQIFSPSTDAERAEVYRNDNTPTVGGYGISIVNVYNSSLKDLYEKVVANKNYGYRYYRPRGDAMYPYRMGDFIGYTPLAALPITHTFNEGQVFSDEVGSIEITGGTLVTDTSLEGQITEQDLYPRLVDDSGNESDPNRGMLVVYEDDNGDTQGLWATTTIPYISTAGALLVGAWASALQGRTAIAMEFFTNYPANANSNLISITNPTPAWDETASGYWFAATPDPIRTISFKAATLPPDDTPAAKLIAEVIFSVNPRYTDEDNTRMTAQFYFSSKGASYGGGSLTNIKYGLYTDRACTNAIEEKTRTSFTIANNTDSSKTFANLTNSAGVEVTYFGVWANGYLQKYMAVLLNLNTSVSTTEE